MEAYVDFFQRPLNVPLFFYEKTPAYSDDELVPYRLRKMIRLSYAVFTLRDPFDGFISLYFHRHRQHSLQTDLSTFMNHAEHTLRAHERHAKCVSLVLSGKDSDAQDLSWVGNETMDKLVHICRHTLQGNEFLQYMYSRSLLRWMRVLGRDRVICVDSRDLIERPTHTFKHVFNLLNIPWQDCIAQTSHMRSSSEFKSRTHERFERLLAGHVAARNLSNRIRHMYRKEFSSAKKLCKKRKLSLH
jgi:hypothetical protein